MLYIDRKQCVRKVVRDLEPWKLSMCLPAHSVLELPAGIAERTATRKGDQLDTSAGLIDHSVLPGFAASIRLSTTG